MKSRKLLGKVLVAAGVFAFLSAPPVMAETLNEQVLNDEMKGPKQSLSPSEFDKIRYPNNRWMVQMVDIIKKGPHFLPGNQFDRAIQPPPANSSPETKADLDAMLAMQAHERTTDQLELIRYEHSCQLVDVFTLDKLFDADTHPETKKLSQMVDAEVLYYVGRLKLKFKRARPTQLEAGLTNVVPVPYHAAYPSGHATQSYAMALTLSAVDPAHADAYKQRAIDVAHRREIAGLHYPSDGVAGRQLASVIVPALLELPAFKAQFEKAQKEFAPH